MQIRFFVYDKFATTILTQSRKKNLTVFKKKIRIEMWYQSLAKYVSVATKKFF